jgi:uncharacterized protein (DUF1330 family)
MAGALWACDFPWSGGLRVLKRFRLSQAVSANGILYSPDATIPRLSSGNKYEVSNCGRGETVSCYCVVDLDVKNRELMMPYSQKVADVVKKYGGRYLARSSEIKTIEGDWRPTFVAILEFPDEAALRRFYASPEYEPLKKIRLTAASTSSIVVPGVPSEHQQR